MSRSQRAEYFGGALAAVCDLMHSYGIPKSIAQREFNIALDRIYRPAKQRESRPIPPISRCADVCARWHHDRQFVDELGRPKPLTWNGSKGTLIKLVSRVVGRHGSREVINQLITRKMLRRAATGGWIPKAKIVSPSGLDSAQILRAATMISRLVRTIAHNTDKKYRGDVLFEVMAQVPRLPTRDLRPFKQFTKSQGLIFAKTVDDWLESRNLRPSQRARTLSREAGVIAFAYHEPSFR